MSSMTLHKLLIAGYRHDARVLQSFAVTDDVYLVRFKADVRMSDLLLQRGRAVISRWDLFKVAATPDGKCVDYSFCEPGPKGLIYGGGRLHADGQFTEFTEGDRDA